jgi:hypothetical protein
MAKSPFERVFSKIDRKRILQGVIKEKIKVYLKNSKNQLFLFRATYVDDQLNLHGYVEGEEPKDFEKVTALFYLGKERYFITTRVKKKDGVWGLMSDQQFYRLNRRAAFRIHIPISHDMTLYISTIRNIEINQKLRIIEISSGGARVHWLNPKRLAVGSIMKGSIQWGQGKLLPIDAQLVHILNDGMFGLRFVHMSPSTQNRLKLLCLETQMELSGREPTS